MFIADATARKNSLVNTFFDRLRTLSVGATEVLNSRIPGSPFFTMVQAFAAMVSDAWDDLVQILNGYSPLTATTEEPLAFFQRPRFQPSECSMSFTIMRAVAADPVIIPAGATIQSKMDASGRVRAYVLQEGFTIPAGAFYGVGTFKSVETGLATSLSSPQEMEVISGASGMQALAGVWGGIDNPLSTWTSGSFAAWVTANASSVRMVYAVQGRDLEDFETWRARCFARWDELSSGATAAAYESWAASYVSADGDSPVAVAKVTQNQVFDSAVSVAPPGQRYDIVDGQLYVMGVEVAIALLSGIIPDPALLSSVGASMLSKMPHTDVVWCRAPNRITMDAGSVQVSYKGPSNLIAQVRAVVQAFFVYDEARPSSIQMLGAEVYKAELIHAIMLIDTRIENVKVTFDVAGKLSADGDLILDPFDQLYMETPATAIVISVVA